MEEKNMLNSLFEGVFNTEGVAILPIGTFLICVIVSLFLGAFIAKMYTVNNNYTKSFASTLALIPAIVCVVIMMVNGNVGVGVAVAGAFSLIRFRSLPGTANEIGAIFLSMGAGIMTGMGYLGLAVIFTIIMCVMMVAYNSTGIWEKKTEENAKTLNITIPENLDYAGVFDDLMTKYTDKYELKSVKTTNMGSLFKLNYKIVLKNGVSEKAFIDDIRCRNGNLEISLVQFGDQQQTTL